MNHGSGLNKRLSNPEGDDHLTKKRKKGFVDSSGKQTPGLNAQHPDKKLLKDRSQMRTSKLRPEGDDAERRKAPTLPPFQGLVDPNDSDMEDQSTKSDVSRTSSLNHFWLWDKYYQKDEYAFFFGFKSKAAGLVCVCVYTYCKETNVPFIVTEV